MITFGTSFVGKVDRVDGKLFVVTKVFQVANVPLVPIEGWIVIEGSQTETFVSGIRSFRGVQLPTQWWSFGWAVIRTVLFGGGLLALLGVSSMALGLEGAAAVIGGPVLGIAMLAAWWRTRRGLVAGPRRARELESLLQSGAGGLPRAIVR